MTENTSFIVKNAFVVKGDGSPGFIGSVGVRDGKIVSIEDESYFDNLIDAEGLLLSPGFIDVHSHSDFSILLNPGAESKVYQGVTTEVVGNCGLSSAPLHSHAWDRWHTRWKKRGLNLDWHEPAEYFSKVEKSGLAINILPLLGHANIRTSIKGYCSGDLSGEELVVFKDLTDKYIKQGYWGVSLGLAYPPGIFAGRDELKALFEAVKENDVFLSVHMRDEGREVVESLDEIIGFAKTHGVRIQISHLKAYGRKNWSKLDGLIERIDEAKESGVDICFDRYPYTGFNTDLDWIMPQEIFDGGIDKAYERLSDNRFKKETATVLAERFSLEDADNIIISDCSFRAQCVGKKLTEIVDRESKTFWLDVIDFILDVRFAVEATFVLMRGGNLRKIFSHSSMMVGSDSSIITYKNSSCPHPRAYGTFPRFLRMVLDEKILSLEEAVYRITGFAAKKMRVNKRGLLSVGYFADMVLWDADKIDGKGGFTDPKIEPVGIKNVWVNGVSVYKTKPDYLPGKLLLRSQN